MLCNNIGMESEKKNIKYVSSLRFDIEKFRLETGNYNAWINLHDKLKLRGLGVW
jgi:hypothetical protein